jgi:hypothetical protein
MSVIDAPTDQNSAREQAGCPAPVYLLSSSLFFGPYPFVSAFDTRGGNRVDRGDCQEVAAERIVPGCVAQRSSGIRAVGRGVEQVAVDALS